MKISVVIAALLLLLSCGKDAKEGGSKEGASKESASKESSGKDASSSAPSANSPGSGPEIIKIDGPAQQKAGIRVAVIRPQTIPEYLTAAGQIVMNEEQTSHVGTYTDGRVTEIHANVGDAVRRGMILARMHSHDVHETRAAYETALQNVSREQSAVAFQRQQLDRMRRLYDLKSASRQEVDRSVAEVRSAEAALADAQIGVEKEVAHLTDILHLPESGLGAINETTEQVPVIAPTSGVVINRPISLGSVVEPGQEVYTVTNLDSVWMIASVNETEIAGVHTQDRARILTQAFPDESFEGIVTQLGAELDPKTRTLQARILVPNPTRKLRPGMYASAQILKRQSRQALFVPEDAVQDLNGGSIVFVRNAENTFEPRVVDIAHRLNGQAELSAGLKAGDAVVVKGGFVVKSEMLKSQIGE